MASTPAALDYVHSTYLAITFPPNSPYYRDPSALHHVASTPSSSLNHVSQVGELLDSHIYQIKDVDKSQWETVKEQVMNALKSTEGVGSVQELKPAQRAKRGGGEL